MSWLLRCWQVSRVCSLTLWTFSEDSSILRILSSRLATESWSLWRCSGYDCANEGLRKCCVSELWLFRSDRTSCKGSSSGLPHLNDLAVWACIGLHCWGCWKLWNCVVGEAMWMVSCPVSWSTPVCCCPKYINNIYLLSLCMTVFNQLFAYHIN